MPSNNTTENIELCELSSRAESEFDRIELFKSSIIFVIIGFISIVTDNYWNLIFQNKYIKNYIAITKLNTINFESFTKTALEHLAPNSIVYGFVISFLLCSLHRIAFGDSNKCNLFNNYVVFPLIIFVKNLSIAVSGIFLVLLLHY